MKDRKTGTALDFGMKRKRVPMLLLLPVLVSWLVYFSFYIHFVTQTPHVRTAGNTGTALNLVVDFQSRPGFGAVPVLEPDFQSRPGFGAQPGDRLPELKINPLRPNRVEPRCKKRRPKEYDLMNRPRDELRKKLKNSGKSG